MSKEKDGDTITELGEDGKLHNITTKAGRLAMELASEKKRLAQDVPIEASQEADQEEVESWTVD